MRALSRTRIGRTASESSARGRQHVVKGRPMKKTKQVEPDDMRSEYSPELIRRGTRGKYAARYREGTNLVLLDPDVADAFPTPEAVNGALRLLLNVARTSRRSR